MRFYSALKAELERVDTGNWESRLGALHARHGTWQKTADALGVDKRTVERWRKGYQPRPRRDGTVPPRQRINPETFVGKIRATLAGDRHAQLGGVDWRRLVVTGTIIILGYEDEPRHEKMHIGRYMTPDAIEGLGAAYVAKDPGRVQRAIDHILSTDYIGVPTRLVDVDDGGLAF